jgi:catechol 2,3-dioxygenase-like lactoylglutathione lyase family enzyme
MNPEICLDHSIVAVSDWEVSNRFYRDVLVAELVPAGPDRVAYRLGDTQLNVHGPGVDLSDNVARLQRTRGRERPILLLVQLGSRR